MISTLQIRQAMISNPHHRLWDKPVNKWTILEKKEFNNLQEKPKPKWKAVNSKKVIRILDRIIYDSISDCRRKNGYCKVVMDRKLKESLEYRFYEAIPTPRKID